MKISLLLERENFKKIFKNSLESFLEDFTGKKHDVNWYSKREKIPEGYSQKWYCNPLINSVFLKGANPNIFDSIIQEYLHNPLKPWRSPIQKLYLIISKHKYFASKMAKYVIEISPPIDNGKNKLIIGGNTKIRFIDVSDKKVYVILKKGFREKYIKREIDVRKNFKYMPVPELYSCSKNYTWYSEAYIIGKSPDRMDITEGHVALLDAVKYIHRMINDTKMEKHLYVYVEQLIKRIDKNIQDSTNIDLNTKNTLMDLSKELTEHLNEYHDNVINVACCHGDFQPGNIINDGKKTWIFDWEYFTEKQIGYDLLVLLLKSRLSNSLSHNFKKIITGELSSKDAQLINNWPEFRWDDEQFKKIYLILFLLEELDFHLDENNNDCFFDLSPGLKNICDQITIILNENKKFFG